jgi:hypothetical protein
MSRVCPCIRSPLPYICSASEITLSNLVVRREALDKLPVELPFRIGYGRVGSIVVHVPGGALAWYFNPQPIRVVVTDVHILVDKLVSTPDDAELKQQRSKTDALELDSMLYRQHMVDLLYEVLSQTSATVDAKHPPLKKSMLDTVMSSIIVRRERNQH